MTADIKHCPVCDSLSVGSISDHLFQCKQCGIAFNTAFALKSYNDTYFLDEYRNQYGKTYIEDYTNIYSLSSRRLSRILGYLSDKKKISNLSLLDIGSATGFFLACARDMGICHVTGIEISEYASRYCTEHFNIPVRQSPFSDVTLTSLYSIITAWYFIEHCNAPVSVMQKIHDALQPGGMFAFSVPSIFGPLFLFNRDIWVQTHPADHSIDFSPSGIKKILTRIGFRQIHIKPGGIHPERIKNPQSFMYKPFTLAYGLFSRLTSFSDTIEVYAVK
jgi:2-polyprenyl-3-methyl-5-hydroxy-6-metoxy-1,4-benzoquinol methylase